MNDYERFPQPKQQLNLTSCATSTVNVSSTCQIASSPVLHRGHRSSACCTSCEPVAGSIVRHYRPWTMGSRDQHRQTTGVVSLASCQSVCSKDHRPTALPSSTWHCWHRRLWSWFLLQPPASRACHVSELTKDQLDERIVLTCQCLHLSNYLSIGRRCDSQERVVVRDC